jgi:hypothetical protein
VRVGRISSLLGGGATPLLPAQQVDHEMKAQYSWSRANRGA